MKKKSLLVLLGLAALLLVVASGTSLGNDQIKSTVTIPEGQPVPIIITEGLPPGTVHLLYTINLDSYPCGDYAKFTLNMTDLEGKGTAPVYPTNVNLIQDGTDKFVSLVADPATVSVTGTTWAGTSTVTISIGCSIPNDKTEVVGNLNAQAADSHLDTKTTVKVFLELVRPAAGCLRAYDFITDTDGNREYATVIVAPQGKVKSSNPGSFLDDVLVANTCGVAETFDLAITLDQNWNTQPGGNPGNATFTYLTAGEVDPNTFNLSAFGSGAGQGEILCLLNVTVPAGESFLATVHSEVTKGTLLGTLGSGPFKFEATLYVAGSGCAAGGPLNPDADPNPATTSLPFTVN